MSNNNQKTWYPQALNVFAEKKIRDAMQLTGRALPCMAVAVSGAIVTVSFLVNSGFTLPQIDVPLFGPEYIRYPIQVGDKGVLLAADARLGAISGLGGETPDLAAPANLGALVFLPIGNANWSSVDGNVLTLYGPNGVTLYDASKNSRIDITPTSITVRVGTVTFVVNATGITSTIGAVSTVLSALGLTVNGNLIINGNISTTGVGGTGSGTFAGNVQINGTTNLVGTTTIQSRPFLTHEHSGVQTGLGNTGGVV